MKKEIKSKREVILKNNSLINTLINSSYLNVLKISENDQKMTKLYSSSSITKECDFSKRASNRL